MGSPTYMRSVVDRNVIMRPIAVLWHANLTSRVQAANLVQYEHTIFQDTIYNGTSTDTVQGHKSNIVRHLIRKLLYLLVALSMLALIRGRGENWIHWTVGRRIQSALLSQNTALSFFLSLPLSSLHTVCMSPAVISTTSSIKHTSTSTSTFLRATMLDTTATYRAFHKNNSDIS